MKGGKTEKLRSGSSTILIGLALVATLTGTFTAHCQAGDASAIGNRSLENFITRRGDQLMDGDAPYRFVGANMPGLVLPYDYWLGMPERMVLATPWEQEDGLKTARRMNFGCLRTWNLTIRAPQETRQGWQYVWGPGEFNEEAFRSLDHLLALANKHGVRLMLPLTADFGDYLGGVGTYAAHRGKPREAFFDDPQIKDDFKATLRHVLTRVNTVTSVPYKDDKAILAWQFGNEMDRTRPGDDVQRAWQAEMAAYMKSLDPNHLIAYGQRFLPAEPDANIDIVIQHFYGSDWVQRCRHARAATRDKRPLVVSEFGMETSVKPYQAVLDEVIDNGTTGIMVWSMYFHHRDGGFWWHAIPTDRDKGVMFSYHWPGFPVGEVIDERAILHALRGAAYRIQGQEIAPRTMPEAPELLPFGGVAMFSWRGSAGARGYDIQRAPSVDGPWTMLAKNVSDAAVAYRPLYSDTATRAGEKWFYRVIARNEAGSSVPSNVVGPVAIDEVCFVDELHDFDLAAAHSDNLQLSNTGNSYFGEYLYRAKGDAGDRLTYKTDSPARSVRIWAWMTEDKICLRIAAAADGENYTPIDVRHQTTVYTSNRGDRRATQVQLSAELPEGTRFVQIEWLGPAQVDRVEIRHLGSSSGRGQSGCGGKNGR